MFKDKYKILSNDIEYSNIYPIIDKKTKEKRIAKIFLNRNPQNTLLNEEIILKRLSKGENIVQFYEKIHENGNTIFIFEKLQGDVMDLIDYPNYTENMGLNIFYKVCKAIKYCHDNNIAHLDIKPDNILFSLHKNDITIKLTDFGFSYITDHTSNITGNRGTLYYNAPEILNNNVYNAKKADIWSLGILFHVLLVKCWPYTSKNIEDQIKTGELYLHPSLPFEYRILIEDILRVNPNKRLDIDNIILKIKRIISSKQISKNSRKSFLNTLIKKFKPLF